MRQRRFVETIRNLFLALLNATLLLLALCLFLALQLSHKTEDIAASFASNLVTLAPLRDEVGAMTAELSGLRGDLQTLREDGRTMTGETADRLDARLDRIGTRLDSAVARIDAVQTAPSQLLDQAIDRVAGQIKQSVGEFGSCLPRAGSAEG